jgi:hypothetical protein
MSVADDHHRSFASWKFDMVDGILFDPRIPAGWKVVALRILQAVNEETRVAYISDVTICDEIPETDRYKCNKVRKLLEQLGWWEVERGNGSQCSCYRFKDTNLNWIRDERIIRREKRQEERRRRRIEGRARRAQTADVVKEPRPGGGHATTCQEVVTVPRRSADVVDTPRKTESKVVIQPPANVVPAPPVHLGITPSVRFSEEDVSVCDSPSVCAQEDRHRIVVRPSGPYADIDLRRILGDGSWRKGQDVGDTMRAGRFEYWRQLLAEKGFSEEDLAALKREAVDAVRRFEEMP